MRVTSDLEGDVMLQF